MSGIRLPSPVAELTAPAYAKRAIADGMSCIPIGSSFVAPGVRQTFEHTPQRPVRGPYLLAVSFDGGPSTIQLHRLQFGCDSLLCGVGPIDARALMRAVVLPGGETEWAPIPLDGPGLHCGNRIFVELENLACHTLRVSVALFAVTLRDFDRPRHGYSVIGAVGAAGDSSSRIRELRAELEAERSHVRRLEAGAIALNAELETERAGHQQWRAAAEAHLEGLRLARVQHAAELAAVTDPAFVARARDAVRTLEALEPSDPFEPGDVWETPADES